MSKTIKKPDCISLKLWSKLNYEQKRVFCSCYNDFINELNVLSKIHNSIKAHNLAYLIASKVDI